jgi:hypothetical protein
MEKNLCRDILVKCNKHLFNDIRRLNKKILQSTNFLCTGKIFPPNPGQVRSMKRKLKDLRKLRKEVLNVLK